MKKALLGAVVALGLAAIGWAFLGRSRESSGHFLLDVRAPSQGRGFSAALEQTVGAPLRPGHKIALLPNGKVFDALTDAIRGAKQSVNIEMYIWSHGKASTSVISALRERKKGVACRVLLDAEGSISRGEEVDKDLRDVECAMLLFRKATALFARNHRKVAVIGGRLGITGGVGFDDKSLGQGEGEDHWSDTERRGAHPGAGAAERLEYVVPLPAARIRRLAQERLPRLGIPADHDAREDDGGGRSAGSHRLGQPRPALLEQARGGCAGRGRSCARNAARAAVRGRRGSVEGAEVKAASSPRGELDVRPARK